MNRIFKALADPSRRLLLDRLRERDGRTLGELADALAQMTRFGVSSHLRVLVAADLISTVKVGREKRHYLNAVPLQDIQSRWLTPFTAMTTDHPDTVFVIYIKANPQQVWDALTDTTHPRPWLYASVVSSDWSPGSRYTMDASDVTLVRGEVLEVEPPNRLLLTFDPCWDEQVDKEAAGRLEYRIETEQQGQCVARLTVLLTGLTGESARSAARDTPQVHSGLKTWIETGQPMRV